MTASRPLTRSPRRLSPGKLTLLAAVATLSLGGCAGTGVDAQTNAQYQAGVGTNVRTGSIQLFNALAVDNGDGTATFSAAILNHGDESAKLTDATARPATGPATDWGVASEPVIIGAGDVVDIGKSGTVVLSGKGLEAGDYVHVTLAFDHGRRVRVEAPVVSRSPIYDEVPTASGEAPTETPTPEAEPGHAAEEAPAH